MDEDEFQKVLQRHSRNTARDYWYWRDKPEMESGAVHEVLTAAGFKIESLTSRPDDPPDCEAVIDGEFCGIEVTELVHEKALARSIKTGKEHHFIWTREDLCAALQSRINRKDRVEKVRGGPYRRYILVVVTDELFLDRTTVERFIAGASFESAFITDLLLGLSYDPSIGRCPVLPIRLSRQARP